MLGSDGEETEYRAVHKLAPNLPPVRLRVVSLSPYMFTPAELELRRRLLTREFAALRAMGAHPNVATAHDVFEDDDGNLVIVSEEVDGLSLAMALTEGLDMSDAERLDLFRQLAKGVAHTHASGVVHGRSPSPPTANTAPA